MANIPLLKHTQVLRDHQRLEGALVADVDCGSCAVEAAGESLRQSFLAAAEQREDCFRFEIPSRVNLMRRN